jgi:hypothetical protein
MYFQGAALHLFLIDYLLYLIICTLLFSSAELELDPQRKKKYGGNY